MKEHNIDHLFRQKLQQHAVAPTPAAWDKLNAGLHQNRRKRGGYYAAAAVIMLLLSAGWFGLQQYNKGGAELQTGLAVSEQSAPVPPQIPAEQTTTGQPQVEKAPAAPETEPQLPAPALVNSSPATALASVAENNSTTPSVPKQAGKPATQKAQPAPVPVMVEVETALATTEPLPELHPQQADLELTESTLPATDMALAAGEPVIIRYDANDVEPAALAMADEAETAPERETAPEKVFSLFQKVKQGEIGLADIRQAKDNLLSGRFTKP